MRNASMDPSKATPSGPESWADCACLHPSPLGNTNATERHFLSPLWFSLSIHDIGSFIQKIQKKNWLLKNYYSSKLSFGHVGLLASKGQTTLSVDSKPLGLLIALSPLFFFLL